MVNLLPQEDRVAIKKEYLRRMVVVASLMIFSVISVVVVLLAPSFVLLWDEEKNFNRQLDYSNQILNSAETEQLAGAVKSINIKIDKIISQTESPKVYKIFNDILALTGKEIKIKSFSYNKEKDGNGTLLSVSGSAPTRNLFLGFVEKIKKAFPLAEVDSPVSNILKDKDIDFSLKIKIPSNEKSK